MYEDGPTKAAGQIASLRPNKNRLEQLKAQRAELLEHVRAFDEAIESLEANPAILNVLEKLDKIGRF